MDADHSVPRIPNTPNPKDFAMGGKIMLSAIVILFLVVVLMVALHLYARWYLLRERRRQLLRRRSRLNSHRRAHIVFYVDNNPAAHPAPNSGLEPSVIASLPVFVYSPKTQPEGMDCAVCLSEFEENEKGRLLPKCNHSFHADCIDMWFHSHSTCPICRAAVEPVPEPAASNSAVEPEGSRIEPGLSSGLCPACVHEEGDCSSTASLGLRRKGLDSTAVRIEVPRRSAFEPELPLSSPASHGFRSPGTRLLSLKRILSMGRKTPGTAPATPCGAGTSCSSGPTQFDLESGPAELTQSRVLTPR
ncbi:RING-H2 finger protein ATL2 [Coffea arabica]|uniref:RING-type E3 ubiquitin transferase n=1 Tax=Coffea arabica TaxID=13443 RepID=A0A6P6WMY1_COFAR|nr:RING-H2 finger protein ATL2-like [Coffea arabica]